ncbi:unnamed protein product [Ixodes persulcatus]
MLHTYAVPSVFTFKEPLKQREVPKVREALNEVCHPTQLQAERASAPIDEAPEDISMELEDDTENIQAQEIHPGDALQNENTEHERDKELQKLPRHIACLGQELLQVKNKNYRLEEENQLLKISCNSMTAKLRSPLDKAKNSNDDFLFYTGLPSYGVFQALLKYLDPGVQGSNIQYGTSGDAVTQNRRPPLLTVEEQLFLTLAKLRLGSFEKDQANRFNISQSTVSRIFSTWVNFLFLRLSELRLWQSRELINRRMPEEFKQCYGTTRVIIDATEIEVEVASSFVLQSETYSVYKSTNTLKGIVGISPDGYKTFLSSLFTVCISDKELVKKSGFLDMPFDDNDSVMADKGFKISDLLQPLGVRLNLPPFVSGGHLSKEDVALTEEIASLRIHVERRIQRIKCFHIFDSALPITLGPLANQVLLYTF